MASTLNDLVNRIESDSSLFHRIVNGPSSGPESIITVGDAPNTYEVKTVARSVLELHISSVGTDELEDGAVTIEKLSQGVKDILSSNRLEDGDVTVEKLSQNVRDILNSILNEAQVQELIDNTVRSLQSMFDEIDERISTLNDEAGNAIVNINIDGNRLTFTKADGSSQSEVLPSGGTSGGTNNEALQALDNRVDDLENRDITLEVVKKEVETAFMLEDLIFTANNDGALPITGTSMNVVEVPDTVTSGTQNSLYFSLLVNSNNNILNLKIAIMQGESVLYRGILDVGNPNEIEFQLETRGDISINILGQYGFNLDSDLTVTFDVLAANYKELGALYDPIEELINSKTGGIPPEKVADNEQRSIEALNLAKMNARTTILLPHVLVDVEKPITFLVDGNPHTTYTVDADFSGLLIDSSIDENHIEIRVNNASVDFDLVGSQNLNGVVYFRYTIQAQIANEITVVQVLEVDSLKVLEDLDLVVTKVAKLENAEVVDNRSQAVKDFENALSENTVVKANNVIDDDIDLDKSFMGVGFHDLLFEDPSLVDSIMMIKTVFTKDNTIPDSNASIVSIAGSRIQNNEVISGQIVITDITSSKNLTGGFRVNFISQASADLVLFSYLGREMLILKGDYLFLREFTPGARSFTSHTTSKTLFSGVNEVVTLSGVNNAQEIDFLKGNSQVPVGATEPIARVLVHFVITDNGNQVDDEVIAIDLPTFGSIAGNVEYPLSLGNGYFQAINIQVLNDRVRIGENSLTLNSQQDIEHINISVKIEETYTASEVSADSIEDHPLLITGTDTQIRFHEGQNNDVAFEINAVSDNHISFSCLIAGQVSKVSSLIYFVSGALVTSCVINANLNNRISNVSILSHKDSVTGLLDNLPRVIDRLGLGFVKYGFTTDKTYGIDKPISVNGEEIGRNTVTTLFNSSSGTTSAITLSQAYTDFDFILLEFGSSQFTNVNVFRQTMLITTANISSSIQYDVAFNNSTGQARISFTNATTISAITSVSGGFGRLYAVRGIK